MTTHAGPLKVYDPATQTPDAATPTGTIAGAFVGNVTGNVTGNLTGQQTMARSTVAATGSTNADAAALSAGLNTVTAGDGTKGVILPAAVAGKPVYVKNNAALGLKVYPPSGAAINELTATTGAYTMAANTTAIFIGDSTTQVWTFPLVAS